MTDRRNSIVLFRILLVLYLIAVAYLCFGSFSGISGLNDKVIGIATDKIMHFAMFLPFPFLCYFSLKSNPDGPLKAIGMVLAIFLTGCMMSAGTEIIQSRIPYRTADPMDFLADGISLAVGSLAVFIISMIRGQKEAR